MSSKEDPPSKPTLEAVQKQFEHWRVNRKRRGPIPEELWRQAVCLADDYPLVQVSKVLRLHYTELKRRVEEDQCQGEEGAHNGTGFIALQMPEAVPNGVDCVVEVQDAKGAKMAITCLVPMC